MPDRELARSNHYRSACNSLTRSEAFTRFQFRSLHNVGSRIARAAARPFVTRHDQAHAFGHIEGDDYAKRAYGLFLLMCRAGGAAGLGSGNSRQYQRHRQGRHGVIPGANVDITNTENGQTQTLVTNSSGLLRGAVAAGRALSVSVEMPASRRSTSTRHRSSVGQQLSMPFMLELGAITENINVTAEAPLLDTSSVSSGQNFDRKLIEGLPMAANQPILLVEIRAGHHRPDHPAASAPGADRRPERRRRHSRRRRRQLQLHAGRRDQRRQQPPHGVLAELGHRAGDARRDVELRCVAGSWHRRQHLADDQAGTNALRGTFNYQYWTQPGQLAEPAAETARSSSVPPPARCTTSGKSHNGAFTSAAPSSSRSW